MEWRRNLLKSLAESGNVAMWLLVRKVAVCLEELIKLSCDVKSHVRAEVGQAGLGCGVV